MCGIFGHYIFQIPRSRGEILATLFAGLHRLEYCGYDSVGIVIDSDDGVVGADSNTRMHGLERIASIDVNVNATSENIDPRLKLYIQNERM